MAKDRCLVVYEFDEIRGARDGEPENFNERILNKKDFQDLKEFVEKNADEDAEDENATKFLSCTNGKIRIRNYVGVIELPSGLLIEILPKVDFDRTDGTRNDEKAREIFLKMLSHLKDFPCRVSNYTNLASKRMPLFEIFINMYATGVNSLVKKGLKSAYVTEEDNLHVYKGKLKVSQHIKYNSAHKERFYMEYDEYQLNRSENKLIKSTLLYLQKKSRREDNRKLIRQMLNHFEMIDSSTNYDSDFSKVVSDRNTKNYADLMVWSKVFLKNKSFSMFKGDDKTRALLFPMETIFERYIAEVFKKTLENRDQSWSVSTQDRGNHLLFIQENNLNLGIFKLRPDIVAHKEGGRMVILDTKWKVLKPKPRAGYGISQLDMYQMYAYAHRYKTPEIVLLYPLNAKMKEYAEDVPNHMTIEFWGDSQELIKGKRLRIKAFLVDLESILENEGSPKWVKQLIQQLN